MIVKYLASKGICANCIAPGTFKTEMARSQWEDPKLVEWYEQRNPSRRFGQTIAVDGGHTISFR